jgi:hypothetical protein
MRPLTTYGHCGNSPRRFIEWISQSTNKLVGCLFNIILFTRAIIPPPTKLFFTAENMKRKESTLEDIMDERITKKLIFDAEYRKERTSREIRNFIDGYYIALSNMSKFVCEDDDHYVDGVYFDMACSCVRTAEARQFLINNFDLYRRKPPFGGELEQLVTHLDWPQDYWPIYGYHPPLRKPRTQDKFQVEECI